MLNHIDIMGRFVREPELKQTNAGIAVVTFTLACDQDYSKGEKKTDFIDCTAWRNTAEHICKYFHKGSLAIVSGRLAIREWKGKDDTTKRAPEIQVDNIYFGSARSDSSAATPEPAATFTDEPDDGELPF